MKRMVMPKLAVTKKFNRKKLYKAGKSWVIAGSVWLTMMGVHAITASADTTTLTDQQIEMINQMQQATVNLASSAAGVTSTAAVDSSANSVASSVMNSTNTSSSLISVSSMSATSVASSVASTVVSASVSANVSSVSSVSATSDSVMISVAPDSSLTDETLASLSSSAQTAGTVVTVTQVLAVTPASSDASTASLAQQVNFDAQTATSYYKKISSAASGQPALSATLSQAGSVMVQMSAAQSALTGAIALANSALSAANHSAYASAYASEVALSSSVALVMNKLAVLNNNMAATQNVNNASVAASTAKSALGSAAIDNLWKGIFGLNWDSLVAFDSANKAANSVGTIASSLSNEDKMLSSAQTAVANATDQTALSSAAVATQSVASATASMFQKVMSAASGAGAVMDSGFLQQSAAVTLFGQATTMDSALASASAVVNDLSNMASLLAPVASSATANYAAVKSALANATAQYASLQSVASAFATDSAAIMSSGVTAKEIGSLMINTASESVAAGNILSQAVIDSTTGSSAGSEAIYVLHGAAHNQVATAQTSITSQVAIVNSALSQLSSLTSQYPTNSSLANDYADAKKQSAALVKISQMLASDDAVIDTEPIGNLMDTMQDVTNQVTQAGLDAKVAKADAAWGHATLQTVARPGSQQGEKVAVKSGVAVSFANTDATLAASGYSYTVMAGGKSFATLQSAEQAMADATGVTADFVVTYTPNDQQAVVTIFDQTTQSYLQSDIAITGKTGTTIDFQTVSTVISNYVKAHYDVVTDGTQAGASFDNNDRATQSFAVVLKHHVALSNTSATYTNTVRYVGANSATPGAKSQELVVTTTAAYDQVTGRVLSAGDATSYGSDYVAPTYAGSGAGKVDASGNITFDAVTSPVVSGYKADQATVTGHNTIGDNKLSTTTVNYAATEQKATIILKDLTDDTEIDRVPLTGLTGQTMDLATIKVEVAEQLADQTLTLDSAANAILAGQTFDNDDETDQTWTIGFYHVTSQVDESVDFTNAVSYTGAGTDTPMPTQQTATVVRHYTVDLHRDKTAPIASTYEVVDGAASVATDGAVTFAPVAVPSLAGYTTTQTQIVTTTPFAKPNVTTTVIYTANPQSAVVTLVDETTGSQLAKVTIAGRTGELVAQGENANAVATALASYLDHGYALVSDTRQQTDSFNATGKQSYAITLVHKTVAASETKSFTNVVSYTGAGTGTPTSSSATVAVTRHYLKDAVTNQEVDPTTMASYATSLTVPMFTGSGAGQVDATTGIITFDPIVTPIISGYTPDKAEVAKALPWAQTTSRTEVTYTPDAQSANIIFIDEMRANRQIMSVAVTGQTAGQIDTTLGQQVLDSLIAKGYVVASNGMPTNASFDDKDAVNQTYTVTLRHGVASAMSSVTAQDTILYGSTGTTQISSVVLSGVVTQTVAIDAVTKSVIATGDAESFGSAYFAPSYATDAETLTVDSATGAITFNKVDSPAVSGYVANPTIVIGHATFANPTTTDTVTYTADPQLAVVRFIDQTTGSAILTTMNINGVTDGQIDFGTTSSLLASYENKHYVIASDGRTAGAKFDHDDHHDQTFDVVLTHQTSMKTTDQTVTETVLYRGAGQQTTDSVAGSAVITRHETIDLVTNSVISVADASAYGSEYQAPTYTTTAINATVNETTGAVTFNEQTTPAISGYTPDQTAVQLQATPTTPNAIITVTYTPDVQNAEVTFIDQTTGKTLSDVALNGVTSQAIDFSQIAALQQNYETSGYELVTTTVPTSAIYDTVADGSVISQSYVVTLKHRVSASASDLQMTATISYVVAGDGVVAPAAVVRQVTVTETKMVDQVTKKAIDSTDASAYGADYKAPTYVVKSGDASVAVTTGEATFAAVTSPKLAGYTITNSNEVVTQTTTWQTPSVTTVVTYVPQPQHAEIKIIDDMADAKHDVLHDFGLTGSTFEKMDTTAVMATLNSLLANGYVSVSNNVPDQATFDSDSATSQVYEVHLTHGVILSSEAKIATNTVTYVGAKDVPPTVYQSVTVQRQYAIDAVTGESIVAADASSYGSAYQSDQFSLVNEADKAIATVDPNKGTIAFDVVPSLEMAGYEAKPGQVAGLATFDNLDVQEVVQYSPFEQRAVVTFEDTMKPTSAGGYAVIGTAYLKGETSAAVDFTYVTSMLTSFTAAGYEVETNQIQGSSYFDASDDTETPSQTWLITMKHRGITVTESATATNTIHYVGTGQAIADHVDSVVVTKTHTVDMVTGSDVSEDDASAYGSDYQAPTYAVTSGDSKTTVDETGHITFAEVRTSAVNGYTRIPPQVTAHATFDQPDAETNVMYHAVQQVARVIFKDDTMGGATLTRVDLGGYTDQQIDFADAQDVLGQYLAAGYQLAAEPKDPYLIDSKQTFTAAVDETNPQAKEPQLFFVHLEHKVVPQTHDVDVSMTVSYTGAGAKTPATQTDSGVVTVTESVDATAYGSDYKAPVYVAKTATVTVDDAGNVTFTSVQTPTVTGYTADETAVTPVATATHPTFTTTVHYTANAQQAVVIFEDVDADNKVVAQTSMAGVTDGAIDFTTAAQVKDSLIVAGYDIVTDGEPTSDSYDDVDETNQSYVVTLRHRLSQAVASEAVANTVHFVGGGVQTPSDVVQTVTVNRLTTTDAVTGQAKISYSLADNQAQATVDETTGVVAFAPIETPTVAGYTPDVSTTTGHATYAVPMASATVTYAPAKQTATVTLVDETTGQTMATLHLVGQTDAPIDFATASQAVTNYEDKHYLLTTSNLATTNYDRDTDAVQSFELTFKHAVSSAASDATLTTTTHYRTKGGIVVHSDLVQTAIVTRHYDVDLVTGAEIAAADSAKYGSDYEEPTWTAVGATYDEAQQLATFPEITDVPTKVGYTPDKTHFVGHATLSVQNTDRTVWYTPNPATATATIVVDVTGQTLATVQLDGYVDDPVDTTAVTTAQNNWVEHGYAFVKSDVPAKNATNFGVTTPSYIVHLTHGTHEETTDVPMHTTIHYVGAPTSLADATQTVTVKRTVTMDDVTGAETTTPTYASADATVVVDAKTVPVSYQTVTSPEVAGYTPDQATVTATTTVDMPMTTTTVRYAPAAQVADVTITDETTGETIGQYDLHGVTDAKVDFTLVREVVKNLVDSGYGPVKDVPTDATYDRDVNTVQHFVVTLRHGQTTEKDLVPTKHTVYFRGAGDQTPKSMTQTVVVATMKAKDAVTGKQIGHTQYEVADDQPGTVSDEGVVTFDQIDAPIVAGYTADQKVVTADAPAGQTAQDTVTYIADTQRAIVRFVDDTTGATLTDLTVTGKTGTDIEMTIASDALSQYETAGYEFVSQDVPAHATFDAQTNSDQQFTVHLRHNTQSATQQLTESQTVIYVGAGDDTPKRVEVSVPVTRIVTVDAVTGQELAGTQTYTTETPGVTVDAKTGDLTFASVASPTVAGYHADKLVVVGHATPTMDGVTFVTYARDMQRVHVVYVDDDQGGRVVMTGDDLTGLSGDAVTYTPAYVPNYVMTYVDQSSAATFDKTTQVDQTITVHLAHDKAPVDNYVTRQIHYWTTNHVVAPSIQTQTVVLHGLMDLVTGQIKWTTQAMPALMTPDKPGYQADVNVVPVVDLDKPTPDWVVNVTYTPASRQTHVMFVDQTTGRELSNVTISGIADGDVDFSRVQSMTASYLTAGYELVRDTTPIKATFATDMPTYQVVLTHRHKQVTKQVTRHVHYETATGVPVPEMVTQTVTMIGVRDMVTGEIVWQPVSVAGVVSPFVPDATADQLVVPGDVLTSPEMTDVVVRYAAKNEATQSVVMAKAIEEDDIKSQRVMLPETGASRDFVVAMAGLLLLSVSAGLALSWFYSEDKH
ncbi:mucin-binding protein [Weissella confusa]|uniref:mucin-binding protein n=1 Tax=Weissella confusa TaxID=1583 RepID=UPI00223B41E1|nr:KxYKxGKxW signal peptide domain-containing protein [Weissella confusa]MCT0013786.1 hypothetical protein [Weissella confusa]